MTDNYLYRAFWISLVPIGGSEKIQNISRLSKFGHVTNFLWRHLLFDNYFSEFSNLNIDSTDFEMNRPHILS